MIKIYTTVLLFCALFFYGQKPIAKFTTSLSGSSISFNDTSSGNPQTYFWEFPNGTPSTSNIANPIVTYSGVAPYQAKLTVSNNNGTSTLTKTISNSSGNVIDLSTGRNNDGSLMSPDAIADNDWSVTNAANLITIPITRITYSGWSYAGIGSNPQNSVWITHGSETGYFDYKSKTFTIPEGVSDAKLNLRSLSFVRNWTSLVKINNDNTTTATQITATSYLSDGAKGWLNSRSPEVVDYPIAPGKYYIKVKLYTNNGSVRGSIDVNANVQYGAGLKSSNNITFGTVDTNPATGVPVVFNSTIEGVSLPVSSYNWVFKKGTDSVTASGQSPNVTFLSAGLYSAKLKVTFSDNSFSTLIIPDYLKVIDYALAPNSYIYDIEKAKTENYDGLYIPVQKAFAMWSERFLNNASVLNNTLTAKVLWQDVSGLIKTLTPDDYSLEIDNVKGIKVIIDKKKGKGNAVIGLIAGSDLSTTKDNIVWSWHIWVTDDPTKPENVSNYGHSGGGSNQLEFIGNQASDGNIIPFTPKYMDRNLGAVSNKFLGDDWNKSGGLMYQWGRKDPIPPLMYKDGTFYEISGALGKYRHRSSSYMGDAVSYSSYFYDRPSTNTMLDNMRYSVNNPLKPIYNSVDANTKTWFNGPATSNLWSDNSKGINDANPELYSHRKGYKAKSSYDPCPNGWRIPSDLSANGDKMNFSPWGIDNEITSSGFLAGKHNIIKPTGSSTYTTGIKVYPSLGMDLSNVNGKNMGVFPGTGKFNLYTNNVFGPVYQDPHETGLWSATMHSNPNTPFAKFTSLIPDPGQNGQPDPINYPTLKGLYSYNPSTATTFTMSPGGCRCMQDPYVDKTINTVDADIYDFPTEYFSLGTTNYTEGLDNPNSYLLTRSDQDRILEIPISKAFSVNNQYLNDQILSIDNLKVNVFWTTNPSLVSNLKIINTPTTLENIKDSKIQIFIPKNQSGNAVISLHKGNVTEPVYWSWHLWVSNTTPSSVTYTTEDVLLPNENYVNWTNSGVPPLTTEFMDRNLGALDALPSIAGTNPENDVNMMTQIKNSGGVQYQWGRKDPIPVFRSPGYNGSSATASAAENIPIYRNAAGPDNAGNLPSALYTTLISNEANYTTSIYVKTYSNIASTNTNKNIRIIENLKYATNNPLTFIYQDNNSANYGNDWLLNEPNAMPERWGHATKKSPFDPCPSGWRVPDKESVNNGIDKQTTDINGDPLVVYAKGNSPWYNGYFKNPNADIYTYYSLGVRETLKKSVSENPGTTTPFYYGKAIRATTNRYGLQFDNSEISGNPNTKYRIGNYPFTGIRGFYPTVLGPYTIAYGYIGSWTAALNSNAQGFAWGLYIGRVYDMATSYTYSPSLAMNVRCVKHQDIYRGTIPANPDAKIIVATNRKNNFSSEKETLDIYPNPVNDILNINQNGILQYDMYDASGKLVKKGSFENRQTSLSSLPNGIYFIKINGSQNIFKIIKK